MNFAYRTDVGLLVYSQCVLWELSKSLFFSYNTLSKVNCELSLECVFNLQDPYF